MYHNCRLGLNVRFYVSKKGEKTGVDSTRKKMPHGNGKGPETQLVYFGSPSPRGGLLGSLSYDNYAQ